VNVVNGLDDGSKPHRAMPAIHYGAGVARRLADSQAKKFVTFFILRMRHIHDSTLFRILMMAPKMPKSQNHQP
jgi:hypothetical protein